MAKSYPDLLGEEKIYLYWHGKKIERKPTKTSPLSLVFSSLHPPRDSLIPLLENTQWVLSSSLLHSLHSLHTSRTPQYFSRFSKSTVWALTPVTYLNVEAFTRVVLWFDCHLFRVLIPYCLGWVTQNASAPSLVSSPRWVGLTILMGLLQSYT